MTFSPEPKMTDTEAIVEVLKCFYEGLEEKEKNQIFDKIQSKIREENKQLPHKTNGRVIQKIGQAIVGTKLLGE